MRRKVGAMRPTKHRHVNSNPSSSHIRLSTSLSPFGIRAQKTKDAVARNAQYAGQSVPSTDISESYIYFYSHDTRTTGDGYGS